MEEKIRHAIRRLEAHKDCSRKELRHLARYVSDDLRETLGDQRQYDHLIKEAK